MGWSIYLPATSCSPGLFICYLLIKELFTDSTGGRQKLANSRSIYSQSSWKATTEFNFFLEKDFISLVIASQYCKNSKITNVLFLNFFVFLW